MEIPELLFWLWRASWQASVMVLFVLLAQWLFRSQLAPRWRYALWMLVVVRLALPVVPESSLSIFNLASVDAVGPVSVRENTSVATGPVPAGKQPQSEGVPQTAPSRANSDADSRIAADPRPVPVAEGVDPGAASTTHATPFTESDRRIEAVGVVSAVYLSGVFVLLVRLIFGNVRFARRLRDHSPVCDVSVMHLFDRCRNEMGIRRDIVILETSEVESPALFGLFRPRLLVPRGVIRSFSPDELRYVFLHELAHIRRGDVFMNWIVALLQVLHWFNPILWFAFRRMRADRELACDALALSRVRSGENTAYGQTILKLLERYSRPAPVSGLVGIMEERTQMKRRIGQIAQFSGKRVWTLPALVLLAVLAVIGLTDAKGPSAATEDSEASERSAAIEPAEEGERGTIRFLIVDDSDHLPLAGAELEVRASFLDERESSSFGPYVTDENGEAEVLYPSAGLDGLSFRVSHEGYVTKRLSAGGNFGLVPESHTMTLGAGVGIGGVVVDEESVPVEGADVDVEVNSGSYQGESILILRGNIGGRTDETGRWSVEGVPAELAYVTLTVSHPGYLRRNFIAERHHGQSAPAERLASQDLFAENATMVLKRGFPVDGRVIDSGGEPVEGATVFFGESMNYGDPQTVVTPENGRFAFRGTEAPVRIFALKEGYGIAVREIVPSPDMGELEVRMPEEHILSGRVVDPEGNAIAEARVVPDDWRLFEWQGTTDSEGNFTWDPAPEGDVTLAIHKPGFLPLRDYTLRAGEEERTITMRYAPRITGRAVDAETGEPVRSFRILLGEDRDGQAGRIYWTRTERFEHMSGEFALEIPEPSEVPSRVRIEADGYLPAATDWFTMSADGHRFDFELTPSDPIRGVVRSPDGEPLVGVEAALVLPQSRLVLGNARILGPDSGARGTRGVDAESDDEGRFSLVPDPDASAAVFVHEFGYAEIPAAEFPSLGEVVLQPWGRIEGVVMTGASPNVHEEVVLWTEDRGRPGGWEFDRSAFRAVTDIEGRFSLDLVPEGTHRIARLVRTGPYGSRSSHDRPIEVNAGEVSSIQLGGSGRTVVGRFVADDPDRDVDWRRGRRGFNSAGGLGHFAVIMEEDGSFRVDDVPAGQYYINLAFVDPDLEDPYGTVPFIASLNQLVRVPGMPENGSDEPYDLGELVIEFPADEM